MEKIREENRKAIIEQGGISPEQRQRLVEEYFRVLIAKSRKEKGKKLLKEPSLTVAQQRINGFKKIEHMTDYVENLEGFVDEKDTGVIDLVKKSLAKIDGI